MLWRLFLLGGALAAALAAGNNWLLRHQRDALTAESAQYRAAAHVCREALREQARREMKFEVSHGVRGDQKRLGRFSER